VDRIEDALSYYMGLKAANVPVELHAYRKAVMHLASGLEAARVAVASIGGDMAQHDRNLSESAPQNPCVADAVGPIGLAPLALAAGLGISARAYAEDPPEWSTR